MISILPNASDGHLSLRRRHTWERASRWWGQLLLSLLPLLLLTKQLEAVGANLKRGRIKSRFWCLSPNFAFVMVPFHSCRSSLLVKWDGNEEPPTNALWGATHTHTLTQSYSRSERKEKHLSICIPLINGEIMMMIFIFDLLFMCDHELIFACISCACACMCLCSLRIDYRVYLPYSM